MLVPFVVVYLLNEYRAHIRRRVALLCFFPAVLGLAAYLVLNQTYRLALEISVSQTEGLLETMDGIVYFITSAFSLLQQSGDVLIEIATAQAMARIGGPVEPLFHVLELTPDLVPYKLGASYNVFLELIPRAIWPDKPITSMNNILGHEYDMLRSDDFMTAISIGAPTEAFMNFGHAGALVIGFLVGFLFTRTHRFFLRRGVRTPLSTALYFPFLVILAFRIQSGLVGAFLGATKLILLALAIVYLATWVSGLLGFDHRRPAAET